MKITLKPITLKNDTLEDIKSGEINTDQYVQSIRTRLDSANYLIKTKLLSLDDLELYNALSKVFDISLDEKDLLTILKEKYGKHYTDITTLTTSMVDSEGNNIVLAGASTKNVPDSNGMVTIEELRKLINSFEFVILETIKVKLREEIINPDKFEDYQFERTSLNNDDELATYKISLLGKEIRKNSTLKKLLALVQQYVKELVYQAKAITRLGEENEDLKEVSSEYKKAFEQNFSKKKIFVEGNHKKSH